MGSIAHQRFLTQIAQAKSIYQLSAISNSLNLTVRQPFYHAALASTVASWDSYLKSLIRDYYSCVIAIGDPRLTQLAIISKDIAESEMKRLNTPNFDNSRAMLFLGIGFDPIPIWSWPKQNMTWQQVNAYFNEILKVRHSFAHGFPLPPFNWTQGKNGKIYLTKSAINRVVKLFEHIAESTDKSVSTLLSQQYNIPKPW